MQLPLLNPEESRYRLIIDHRGTILSVFLNQAGEAYACLTGSIERFYQSIGITNLTQDNDNFLLTFQNVKALIPVIQKSTHNIFVLDVITDTKFDKVFLNKYW